MTLSLPDILEADLDIIFIGINPGNYSAKAGHYYAHPANRFWPMLYQSGLVPIPLLPIDDWKCPRFGIGMSDLVKKISSGSHALSPTELKTGADIVRNKIFYYRPKFVCLNGLIVCKALFGHRKDSGLTQNQIGPSKVFSIPSTSPRNASYSTEQLLDLFKELNTLKNNIRP